MNNSEREEAVQRFTVFRFTNTPDGTPTKWGRERTVALSVN